MAAPTGNLPTGKVLLDNGTGAYALDVTAYVRLAAGVKVANMGRTDEFSQVQPTVLSLTFENFNGEFTLGSTVLSATPIYVDQPIRYVETFLGTDYIRFTGWVQEWPVEWPDSADTFAVAAITATDLLARMGQFPTRSLAIESGTALTAVGFWSLTDNGQTFSPDLTGRSGANMAVYGSLGSSPVFGNQAIGVLDTGAAALLLNAAVGPDAPFLNPPTTATGYSLAFAFSLLPTAVLNIGIGPLPANSTGVNFTLSSTGVTMSCSNAGVVTGTGTIAGSIATGSHDIVIVVAAGGATVTIYVDGTLFGSSGWTGTGPIAFSVQGVFIANVSTTVNAYVQNMLVSSIPLSAAQAALWHSICYSDVDVAGVKIARYLSWVNAPTLTSDATGTPISHIDTNGQSVTALVQAVAAADDGVFYINGSGTPVYNTRNLRFVRPVLITLTPTDWAPGTKPTVDKQKLINYATGKAADGVARTALNQASIATSGRYAKDQSLPLVNGLDLQARLDWLVYANGTVRPRVGKLHIDLLTLMTPAGVLDTARIALLLAMKIGDPIAFSGLPSQAPSGLSSLYVEGWDETRTVDEWSLDLNLSPGGYAAVWVLDSATYSVLDSTTRLAY